MPGRDRRGNPCGPNGRLTGPRQTDVRLFSGGGPRHRERPATGLSQPGRRPGRTGCSMAPRLHSTRPFGGGAIARFRREHHELALDQGRRWLGLQRGRSCRLLEGDKADYAACCWAWGRDYVPQDRISRRSARHLRRQSIPRFARRSRVDAPGHRGRAPASCCPLSLFTAQVSLDDAAKLAASARQSSTSCCRSRTP